METTRSLEDIDYLLQRNWFLDVQDVLDLLYMAEETDWQWIIQNRNKYDTAIHDIICCEAGLPNIHVNMKIRDISDSEYDRMLFDAERDLANNIEQRWQNYKAKHRLTPPPSVYYGKKLDELNAELAKETKEYSKYSSNKSTISVRIQTLKNEIDKVQDKISQNNKDWEFITKSQLHINGSLPKLPKEESHRSNV